MISPNPHLVNRQSTIESTTNCRPTDCPKVCYPVCESDFTCIYQTVTECGICPEVHCMRNSFPPRSIESTSTNTVITSKDQTALIAGLTTGIVVLVMIISTIIGLALYRRRRRTHRLSHENKLSFKDIPYENTAYHRESIAFPTTILSSISEISADDPIPYWNKDHTHPQSPIIIGAQSLQIPHLDAPSTSSVIRRSLNLQSTPTIPADVYRSSSVKVTKYDYKGSIPSTYNIHPIRPTFLNISSLDEEDEIETPTLRRAVSVKKNNSTHSHSSSVTRIGSVTSEDAKIMCAKPTLARINTSVITRNEGGLTKKASVRTIVPEINHPQEPLPVKTVTLPGRGLYYPTKRDTSQMSLNSNTSNNSMADGEITVYMETEH
ncbi:hypothetical protein BDB01DRAFT_798064 [Pilobolus umbonatus]|nr:hypothetical protein BDB01DRAFT_798064 [Pilobolus umbonatus]